MPFVIGLLAKDSVLSSYASGEADHSQVPARSRRPEWTDIVGSGCLHGTVLASLQPAGLSRTVPIEFE